MPEVDKNKENIFFSVKKATFVHVNTRKFQAEEYSWIKFSFHKMNFILKNRRYEEVLF